MTLNFRQACQNVGIPHTDRQYRKWRNRRGLAYKFRDINVSDSIDPKERFEFAKQLCNERGATNVVSPEVHHEWSGGRGLRS